MKDDGVSDVIIGIVLPRDQHWWHRQSSAQSGYFSPDKGIWKCRTLGIYESLQKKKAKKIPLICSLSVSLEEIVLQSTETTFITRGGLVSKKMYPLCIGGRLKASLFGQKFLSRSSWKNIFLSIWITGLPASSAEFLFVTTAGSSTPCLIHSRMATSGK